MEEKEKVTLTNGREVNVLPETAEYLRSMVARQAERDLIIPPVEITAGSRFARFFQRIRSATPNEVMRACDDLQMGQDVFDAITALDEGPIIDGWLTSLMKRE